MRILFLAIVTLFLYSCKCKKNTVNSNSNLLKICPEEWIQNRMPGPGTNFEEYYIVDGKRRELKEFDLEWVKKNCNIKPTVVQ
jgi:hypothetical protein